MTNRTRKAAAAPVIRCAIYTRKSTEEGLEQEFNSLDAQRESGENYIKSQANEGWECLPDRYRDQGCALDPGAPCWKPSLRYESRSATARLRTGLRSTLIRPPLTFLLHQN